MQVERRTGKVCQPKTTLYRCATPQTVGLSCLLLLFVTHVKSLCYCAICLSIYGWMLQLSSVNWRLCLTMSHKQAAAMRLPTATLQLNVSQNAEVWCLVILAWTLAILLQHYRQQPWVKPTAVPFRGTWLVASNDIWVMWVFIVGKIQRAIGSCLRFTWPALMDTARCVQWVTRESSLVEAKIPLDLSCRRPSLRPGPQLFLEQIICWRPVTDLSSTCRKRALNLTQTFQLSRLNGPIFVTCSNFRTMTVTKLLLVVL